MCCTRLKKLKQNLPLPSLVGQGRKRASTQNDDRQLLHIMKKDRTKYSQMLATEWTLSNGKHLCASTARRCLISMGYKSYTAKRKPLRTPAKVKSRLTFAKDHQYWLDEWNYVIWSDEAHFEVLNRKNRTLVRRLKLESNEPFNFVPRAQGGGGVGSVWGCMVGNVCGPLMIYTGRINSRAYIKTIEGVLPMFIKNTFDQLHNNPIYMHDNAPPHTSKYSKKCFKHNNINVLNWPASSPGLNPIKSLWDYMDKEFKKLKPTNTGQIQTVIQDLWGCVTPMQCKTLVDSMPRRIKQCILARDKTFSKY